jgi:hypothetical protein
MPKALVKLPNGTTVEIEGSTEEVQRLLEFYGLPTEGTKRRPPAKETTIPPVSAGGGASASPTEVDLAGVVKHVRTSADAEAIEAHILDRTSEVNRVLLPLYVVHQYMADAFGLTTVEISAVTKELGIRVSRQNALRALKGSGARYVVGDRVRKKGLATRYKINRRGVQYMKEILSGGGDAN